MGLLDFYLTTTTMSVCIPVIYSSAIPFAFVFKSVQAHDHVEIPQNQQCKIQSRLKGICFSLTICVLISEPSLIHHSGGQSLLVMPAQLLLYGPA